MVDDMLIGPFISDNHMTGHNYLDFQQNGVTEQLVDVPLATQIAVYFQHVGAPSHYAPLVMQHLGDSFPNWWISRIRKEGQSDTDTTSHSNEDVFYSQVGLYLFRDTK
jgi:hypothetical protein